MLDECRGLSLKRLYLIRDLFVELLLLAHDFLVILDRLFQGSQRGIVRLTRGLLALDN